MIRTLFYTALLISAPALADTDYCHQPETNAQWQQMVKTYPDDDLIIHLAGLREGLCAMIDRGEISKNKAIDIFESARGGVIQQRFTEQALEAEKAKTEI